VFALVDEPSVDAFCRALGVDVTADEALSVEARTDDLADRDGIDSNDSGSGN